ncbi:MAG: ABC transporter ATP-binding protein [Chloroflexi bacterium]|nr:ABC transporter ATP-binding protein [Chloroflexota bacterium]MBI2982865.1 ABC transporter ATP-binding protein [Chloroflexota bacterium]
MTAIETRGLTKDYGLGRGILDLDLAVNEGEVFGFLGPNGAGKTTTIRLLMGMIRPSRGSGSVFGLDVHRQSVDVKRIVGYVPGELPQFGGWRGEEIAAYLAGLRGSVADGEVETVARHLDLDLSRKYREYSHGNKQKLALTLAFMHHPRLLILDEPTSGLDPLHQQAFFELLRDARARGATVFLSSHVLSEVEQVCDRVGIVKEARLITVGPIGQLMGIRTHLVEIEFAGAPPVERLRAVEGLEQLAVADHRISAMVRGSFEPLMSALAGHRVVTFASREPSLEEIFLSYYR